MLEKVFLQILDMSFTAGFVIIFVLLARLLLKKSPKIISYALWGVVLFRLICPFSFESVFSLLPVKTNSISQGIIYAPSPAIDTGIPVINHAVNSPPPMSTPVASINPLQSWIFIGSVVWLAGIVILLIYSTISLVRLQKRLKDAVHESENIYLSEHLGTPFVMGIIRPKIYLPSSLTNEEKRYILLHEKMHIRRFDHVVKILSFFVLCMHWFNPFVWAAFFTSGKDMEMSCDEAVIKKLGDGVKKEYSISLLTLAAGRCVIGGTPLAFCEGDTKGRIRNVLNYKKPAYWMVATAAAVTVILAVALLANPVRGVRLPDADDMNFSVEMLERAVYGNFVAGNELVDFTQAKVPEIADFIKNLRMDKRAISLNRSEDRDSTNQIHLAYEEPDGKTIYNLYFNFNADFTQVWLDNETKPSLSYLVKKPEAVNVFFERQFGSTAKAPEILFAEELWKARTKYVGNNSAVGNIISLLQFPEDVVNDGFELHTNEQPYGITINLKTDTDTYYHYAIEMHQEPFIKNAIIMLTLIENAEFIIFVLDDDHGNPFSFQISDGIASAYLGKDYFARTDTFEGFDNLLHEISEKVSANTEKIRKQNKDAALNLWVSPDESLQTLGCAVIKHWGKSFMGYAVPPESRIEGFSYADVTVIEVEPEPGTKWTEMPYHYIIKINYSIDTATEKYLSSVDGIAGKGTFDGLYRELFVKDLGGGNIRIVNVVTDGGESAYPFCCLQSDG